MTFPSPDKFPGRFLALALLGLSGLAVHAQPVPPTRGELLYTTHCITCHSAQMHWRNNRRASDWDSLQAQVRLWQGNAGLQWDETDISAVAAYLNATIYHYPRTVGPVGLKQSDPPPRVSVAR